MTEDTTTPALDPASSIDCGRFRRLHLVVVLCGLTILFDGYALTIYGAALPRMIEEFGISPAVAGTIGSSALLGMMIGAVVCGMLADRFGRKRVIAGCVVLYSVFYSARAGSTSLGWALGSAGSAPLSGRQWAGCSWPGRSRYRSTSSRSPFPD